MGKWYSENQQGKNNAHWRGGKVKRVCMICSTVFPVKPHKIKDGIGKFCSRKCKDIGVSVYQSGENAPNWQGGITSINARKRGRKEYKLWREAVYLRDNFTCQKCGVKNGLRAYHIKPFKDFPELRLAIDNGITLCKRCHNSIFPR